MHEQVQRQSEPPSVALCGAKQSSYILSQAFVLSVN